MTDNSNVLKPNVSRILMSDVLKDKVPELESDAVDELQNQYVHVVADRRIGGQQIPIAGLLVAVLFGAIPELDFKVELSEALITVKADQLSINSFELQHGDVTVPVPGPFYVKAARIQDIDVFNQTCVLSLQLQRVNA